MHDLFFSSGTGHSLMVLSFVIGLGLMLGKIRIKGVSAGAIWILFVGILFSALGMKTDPLFLHFIKEFGLILFVFSIGLEAGPGFFSSFRRGGLRFNLLSFLLVGFIVLTTLLLGNLFHENIPEMVGTMSGAVTNTPGMGTAQQTWYDTVHGTFLAEVNNPGTSSAIANAFAVAYPVGLVVTLLLLALLRVLFRVDPSKEQQALDEDKDSAVESLLFEVVNPAAVGKRLSELREKFSGEYTVERIVRVDGETLLPGDDPILAKGDRIWMDLAPSERNRMRILFGKEVAREEEENVMPAGNIVTRKIMVTKSSLTGKRIKDLDLEKQYGVSIVRILRTGVELVAQGDMYLQMGDGLRVVGDEEGIAKVSDLVGNKSSELDKPNLIPVFIGIGLGLILGAIPIRFSFMSHAARLGLAAGPLLLGIIIGHFGPRWKVTTYTSASALRMVREIGLCLLLATVGLGAGAAFPQTFAQNGGHLILYAALIAFVPGLLIALIARYGMKQNYFHICGLLAGATTNPVALDYVRQKYGNDHATLAYVSVYPFALFLQVLAAQLLILLSVA